MTETPTTSDRNKNLNAASGAAQKRLKEAHIEEFNTYMKEEANKRGETWKPKASAKEKAKADFEKLLAENPEFADDFRVVEPVSEDMPEPPAA